jgi:hypothetical protein
MGLKNAPALFNRAVITALQGVGSVRSFFDDVIGGTARGDHLSMLRALFTRMREKKLMAQPSKTILGKEAIPAVGFVLSAKGLGAEQGKVEAMQAVQVPSNVKGVQRFLGLVGYYRRFIRAFAEVAKPLYISCCGRSSHGCGVTSSSVPLKS